MQIRVPKGKTRLAQSLVCKILTSGGMRTVAARYVTHVVLCAGQPSYFLIAIPMKEFGPGAWTELKPNCAMFKSGPAKDLPLMGRASVGLMDDGDNSSYSCLMNGWIVYSTHTWSEREDSILVAVFDDLFIMDKYTVFGRMIWNPATKKHFFNTNPNDPTTFNVYGHGNGMDKGGGSVRFCEGWRYGHTASSDSDPNNDPEIGKATDSSRKFTCADIIDGYLREQFSDVAKRPKYMQDYGLSVLPPHITWPRGLASALGENRTPRDFSIDGMSLLAAIQKVVRYAGPYDISLVPTGDFTSQLKIINYAPKDSVGVTIYGQGYDASSLADAMTSAAYVKRGYVKESATGFFPRAANTGDSPAVELMASTDSTSDGAAALFLERSMSPETFALFKAYITAHGDTSTAFDQATKLYPDAINFHRIRINKNPFAGTKYDKLANDGYLRIRANQLTSYNSSAASPLGLIPREVVVEYKMTDFEYFGDPSATPPVGESSEKTDGRGPWKFASRYTDLQLSPCGRFLQIPGVRDAGNTWYCAVDDYGRTTGIASAYEGANIRPREIRVQLAVEGEHCLIAHAGQDVTDPRNTMARIDGACPQFTYLSRNQPMQYINWERRADSWPCGRGGLTASEITTFPSRTGEGNELFTDNLGNGDLDDPRNRMQRHANITLGNVKRIAYEGRFTFGMLTNCYRPGLQISYENGDTIPNTSIVKCVILDRERQEVDMETGPNEWSAIWDGPLRQMSSYNGSGTSSGGGGSTSGTTTDQSTVPGGGIGTDQSGGGSTTQTSGGAGRTGGGENVGMIAAPDLSSGSDTAFDTARNAIKNVGSMAQQVAESPMMSGPSSPPKTISEESKTTAPNRQDPVSGPKSKAEARSEKAGRKAAGKAEKKANIEAGKKVQRSNQGGVDTREMDAANKATDESIHERSLGSARGGERAMTRGEYDEQRRIERGVGKDMHVTGQGRDKFAKSADEAKAARGAQYESQRMKERGVGPDRNAGVRRRTETPATTVQRGEIGRLSRSIIKQGQGVFKTARATIKAAKVKNVERKLKAAGDDE